MGKNYSKAYTTFPELLEYKSEFDALRIEESDVGKLYKFFQRIDADGSGCIDVTEILVFLHIEKTRFTVRVFSILDFDNSGQLSFDEFVIGIWNYCTLQKSLFEVFAFDLYDADKSGAIDVEEAQSMVRDVYGSQFETDVHAKRAHHKLKELHTDCIDLQGFLKFSKTHNNLLYPAYALQARIIENVCGDSFWAKQAESRLSISHNKYVPVTKLLGDGAAAGKKKRKPTVVTSSDPSPLPLESALTGTTTNVRVRKKSTDGSGNAKAVSTFPSKESNSPTKASPSKTHAPTQGRRKSAPKVQPFDSFVTSSPLPSPIDVRQQQQQRPRRKSTTDAMDMHRARHAAASKGLVSPEKTGGGSTPHHHHPALKMLPKEGAPPERRRRASVS